MPEISECEGSKYKGSECEGSECEGLEGEFVWVIGDSGLIGDGWDISDVEWGYQRRFINVKYFFILFYFIFLRSKTIEEWH